MLKNTASNIIIQNFSQAQLWSEELLKRAEYGFFEFETSHYLYEEFTKMGYECERNLAITGLRATKKGRKDGPHICVIGELDAVNNIDHPNANAQTCAAHACGHHLQMVQMLSVAYAFANISNDFCGTVSFLGCPAEEFIQLEQRQTLIDEGKIHCFSGKQELILKGVFDDVDMVLMLHAHPETPEKKIFTQGSSLGFTCKTIDFKGKATHGSTPHAGINALNAALLTINGINANRETFEEKEHIKIHPIITKGGDQVNNIPGFSQIQTYVRGSSIESINKACTMVDNCAKGASMMIGATVHIENLTGYLPLIQDVFMSEIFENNVAELLGNPCLSKGVDMVGSSDIGDISHIIPTIQPTFGGFVGTAHSKEFKSINDYFHRVEIPQIITSTILDLLKPEVTKNILDNFRPIMTIDQYKKYLLG